MREPSAPKNVIYALTCSCHSEQGIRYVGLTSQGLAYRMRQHRRDSMKPTKNRMHLWMREHDVQAAVLEEFADRSQLRVAEIRWMARLRGQGADLLNGTDFWRVGADGVWTRAA